MRRGPNAQGPMAKKVFPGVCHRAEYTWLGQTAASSGHCPGTELWTGCPRALLATPLLRTSLPLWHVLSLLLSSSVSFLYRSPRSVTLSGDPHPLVPGSLVTVCVSEDPICPSLSLTLPVPCLFRVRCSPIPGTQDVLRLPDGWRVWAGEAGRVLSQAVWPLGPHRPCPALGMPQALLYKAALSQPGAVSPPCPRQTPPGPRHPPSPKRLCHPPGTPAPALAGESQGGKLRGQGQGLRARGP